jgi:hypothetical protein
VPTAVDGTGVVPCPVVTDLGLSLRPRGKDTGDGVHARVGHDAAGL